MSRPIFLIPDEDPEQIYFNEEALKIMAGFRFNLTWWSLETYERNYKGPPPEMKELLQTAQFSWVFGVIPWGSRGGALACKRDLERLIP